MIPPLHTFPKLSHALVNQWKVRAMGSSRPANQLTSQPSCHLTSAPVCRFALVPQQTFTRGANRLMGGRVERCARRGATLASLWTTTFRDLNPTFRSLFGRATRHSATPRAVRFTPSSFTALVCAKHVSSGSARIYPQLRLSDLHRNDHSFPCCLHTSESSVSVCACQLSFLISTSACAMAAWWPAMACSHVS
jgi:hypothetical protein